MYRYVCFLWNRLNPSVGEAAEYLVQTFRRRNPTWAETLTESGAAAFHPHIGDRSIESFMLPRGAGIVLGTLFPIDLAQWSPQWTPVFGDRFTETAVLSGGRHLIETFWGRYVALLNGRAGRDHYVIRDCSGRVPCFALQHRGVHIIFAEIGDLACLSLPPFSINQRFLAGFIFSAEMAQRECGLDEVREVLAGDCLLIRENSVSQLSLWNPAKICGERTLEDFNEARNTLRSVTQQCVGCWASRYGRIVHKLSGGLDSTIVLGCLQRSPVRPRVTCINTHSVGPEADERRYARLAAAQADAELIELPLYPDDVRLDRQVFDLPESARPSILPVFEIPALRLQNSVAQRLQAEATWTGHGGDHLFLQSSLPLGAIDYVHDHGPTGNFWPAVRDSVRLSKLPYWQVLRLVARFGWLNTERNLEVWKRRPMFLRPDLAENIAQYVEPPWTSDAACLPPGKRLQVAMLAELLNRHRPIPGLHAAQHHPLLSQPLMELCLQIPTYTLLCGGRDRALARDAFSDHVPAQIIARTAKGTISSSLMYVIRRSSSFTRELIMQGELIREGIIDRAAVEPYVVHGRPVDQWSLWPLLSCIAAEIWLRKWMSMGRRLKEASPPPHVAIRD